MLYEFLQTHRAALIARCQQKRTQRPARRVTDGELRYGVPIFVDQLIGALREESTAGPSEPGAMSFVLPASQTVPSPSDIGRTAAQHGNELLQRGYTLDQVVHDYGDLCQAVTEMAGEQGATVTTGEFRTLNRCLDEAIADAVAEFGRQRDRLTADENTRVTNERLGFFAHELRNLIGTATVAHAAIKRGGVGLTGATGTLLDRSLIRLRDLIDRTLMEVRLTAGIPARRERVVIADLFDEVRVAAAMEAEARDLAFIVAPIAEELVIDGDRAMLAAALANLLQNAVKFTRPESRVSLNAHPVADRILIQVEDECGGLPEGKEAEIFSVFGQLGSAQTGLGLGLPISRRGVEANSGTLYVRNRPGAGCVFIIDLPRPSPPVRPVETPGP